MDKKFDLNHQYSLYLQRVGLTEERMAPNQRIEMKRAFMGAVGQILLLCRDDLPALPTFEESISVMQDMINQVGNFWNAQIRSQN